MGKLGDLLTSIKDGFKAIIDWFKDFHTMLGKLFDKWFNPNSDQLEGEFDLKDKLAEKLKFIDQFKTSISSIQQSGQVLQLPIIQFGSWKIDINGKFFEAAVPKIRSGLSTLFWVMYFLCCFRMISGVFNIGVGKGSSAMVKSGKE